jgi:hypothetical protein
MAARSNDSVFEQLEKALRSQGADAAFTLLIQELREQRKYPLLFEARLMWKRFQLGQPLLQPGKISDLPSDRQATYEAAVMEAARETGGLFLADGEIARAWPYFRAVGDLRPVAEAIDRIPPGGGSEPVIQIALNEGVNPRRGFELFLEQQGICSAISLASQYPDDGARIEFLGILVRALSRELAINLKKAIASAEGRAPDTDSIAEMIDGRDWLFAGSRYYTENSHLLSLVQASPQLQDRETLGLARELAEYGQHLDPMYHFPSQPPFTDTYTDYAAYLRAILGQDVDQCVAHFRTKVADSAPGSAEVLVILLTRLGRYREALDVSRQYLGGDAGTTCPSALQLCQMAGDFEQLRQLAREEGDLLAFTAGVIQAQAQNPKKDETISGFSGDGNGPPAPKL